MVSLPQSCCLNKHSENMHNLPNICIFMDSENIYITRGTCNFTQFVTDVISCFSDTKESQMIVREISKIPKNNNPCPNGKIT